MIWKMRITKSVTMIDETNKDAELIALYEHFLKEMREVVNEKIIVLDEVSELLQSIKKIEERLEQLYVEDKNGEIT